MKEGMMGEGGGEKGKGIMEERKGKGEEIIEERKGEGEKMMEEGGGGDPLLFLTHFH